MAAYRVLLLILLTGMNLLPATGAATGWDLFSTQDDVSATPAKSMVTPDTSAGPCEFNQLGNPLRLLEAVERALCNNTQTRQAWVNVAQQAAIVGTSKAAYLPTITGSYTKSTGNYSTSYVGYPAADQHQSGVTENTGLNLTWVLYDFGQRSANLENSLQLLAAANASQDDTLQKVFLTAAQDYYALLTAQEQLAADVEAEKSAQESYMAAAAKYQLGVNALVDKLQAQTSYAQAKLKRVKSYNGVKTAQGTLAIDMGLDANTPIILDTNHSPLPEASFLKSVDALIDEAKKNRPDLRAAQAQLLAAQAKVKATRATGLPSISLVGSMSSQNQLAQIFYPETITRNQVIGIQLNVPLFDGFLVNYQTRSAQAQADIQAVNLSNAELQITLDVWKSYQALKAGTEDLVTTKDLLQSANQAFAVAQGRYRTGVGSIIELLSAQSALGSAQQQRIQALSNWYTARLKMAQSLGQLGLWAIQ